MPPRATRMQPVERPSNEQVSRYACASVLTRGTSNAPLCVAAMVMALLALGLSDELEPTDLRQAHGDLLDALVSFISTPLSVTEFADLQTRWSKCRCDIKGDTVIARLHDTASEPSSDLVEVLILAMSIIIWNLELANPLKVAGGSASSLKWPGSSSRLLPSGPDQFIAAIEGWLEVTGPNHHPMQTYPFELLTTIIPFCDSLKLIVISSQRLRDVYAERFVRAEAVLTPRVNENIAMPGVDEGITHLSRYYDTLTECLDDFKWDEQRYWLPNALDLYRAADRLRRRPKARLEAIDVEIPKALEVMQFSFWRSIPVDDRPNVLKWTTLNKTFRKATSSQHEYVLGAIMDRATQNACAGPSCLKAADKLDAPPKKCQRCTLLRYCSRECQKEHWKWSPSPHKEFCALTSSFTSLYWPLHDDVNGIRTFKLVVEAKGLSWEDGMEVAKHLRALTTLQDERRRRMADR